MENCFGNSKNRRPVLRGFLIPPKQMWTPGKPIPKHKTTHWLIKVYCPYCDLWHTHGWDDTIRAGKVSHRGAHCNEGPFKNGGYYIAPFRKRDFKHLSEDGALFPFPGGQAENDPKDRPNDRPTVVENPTDEKAGDPGQEVAASG